jgi:hypothetical protein
VTVKIRKRSSDRPATCGTDGPDEVLNVLWLWSLALAADDASCPAFVQIELKAWSPSYRPYARA